MKTNQMLLYEKPPWFCFPPWRFGKYFGDVEEYINDIKKTDLMGGFSMLLEFIRCMFRSNFLDAPFCPRRI